MTTPARPPRGDPIAVEEHMAEADALRRDAPDEIVFFDLETGGLEAKPSIMSREQWGALEKFGRGPKPAFDVDIGPASEDMERLQSWIYCPGNPITQIAAIACDAGTLEPIEEFEVKLHFRSELASPEALEKNSYDADLWQREGVFYPKGLESFCAFLDKHKTVEMVSERTGNPYRVAQLAGHNAASFDLDFILRSCQDPLWQRYALPGDAPRTEPPRGLFFPGSFQVLDTLHLARWAYRNTTIENLKLETLAGEADYSLDEAHDALADCRATLAVARFLMEKTRL